MPVDNFGRFIISSGKVKACICQTINKTDDKITHIIEGSLVLSLSTRMKRKINSSVIGPNMPAAVTNKGTDTSFAAEEMLISFIPS